VLVVRGIPTTTIPRTLLDLAEVLSQQQLRRTIEQAEVVGLFDLRTCTELWTGASGRRGLPTLVAALREARAEPGLTRSELEERFLRLLRDADLPPPALNATIAAAGEYFEVDFHWPAQRLIVEADGHRTHGTRIAFERDRARDRLLTEAGWRVVRVTWRQVAEDQKALARSLRALLSVRQRR
jgi:very-short-patch-repair endonuclease